MEAANSISTQSVGTPLWMAPEVVISNKYGSECGKSSFSHSGILFIYCNPLYLTSSLQ